MFATLASAASLPVALMTSSVPYASWPMGAPSSLTPLLLWRAPADDLVRLHAAPHQRGADAVQLCQCVQSLTAAPTRRKSPAGKAFMYSVIPSRLCTRSQSLSVQLIMR
jgi:hypothetical protein